MNVDLYAGIAVPSEVTTKNTQFNQWIMESSFASHGLRNLSRSTWVCFYPRLWNKWWLVTTTMLHGVR